MKQIGSIVVVAMLSVFIACGGGGGGGGGIVSPPPPPPPPPPTTCPDFTLCMRSSFFEPTTITIAKGTTVSFQNNSGVDHNIVFDNTTSGASDVGPISSGTVVRQINTTGAFGVHCLIHAGMKATITVQ